MRPGASWKPFIISIEEYLVLKKAVIDTPIYEIEPYARYAYVQFKFDDEYDLIEDQFEWMKAICDQHRESWLAELNAAGKHT